MSSSSSLLSTANVTMPSMSAGVEAGVGDRRPRGLGRELQLAAPGRLRELGLADAGDRGAIAQGQRFQTRAEFADSMSSRSSAGTPAIDASASARELGQLVTGCG